MRDKESIRRELAKLNLPPIVAQIFNGAATWPALSYRCEAPRNSLLDGSGFPEHLLPLWEGGTTVTAYDLSDETFCKIDLETEGDVWYRVQEFDGVVAELMIDLWEDEIADSELAELAREFRFGHLSQLVTTLEGGPASDYDTWRAGLRTTSGEK